MGVVLQYATILVPLLCYSLTLFPTTTNGVLRVPKIVQQAEPAENYDDDSSPTSVLSGPESSPSSSSSLNVGKEYSKKLFDGKFPPIALDTNSKQLRIAVVAPLFESIPPKNHHLNGIMPSKERPVEELSAEYVYNLVEMLVKNGHDVTLFASSDSMTSAKLISAYPAMRENRALPGIWNHPYIWMFEQIRQRANEFDIIHFNTIEHLVHMKPYIHKALTTLHAQPGGSTVDNELLSQLTAHQQLFDGANVAVSSDQAAKSLKAKKALRFCQLHIVKSYNGASNQWQQIANEYVKIYRTISRLNELKNVKASLLPAVGSSSIANGSLAEAKNQEQKINCENVYDILNKSKPLRIAIVTPPILDALPPTKGGGTERMVYFLTEQLAQRGNKVTLIAPIGTKVSNAVDLRTIPYKTNPWAGKSNWLHHMLPVLYSQKYVSEHAHEFDILHFHDSDHFVLMRDFVDRVVVTRHLPIDDLTFFNTFNQIPMVSISDEQRKHVPNGIFDLNWIGTVHNGIPLDQLTFRPNPGTSECPYLAWMGRMAPEKGVDIAIEFALWSGIKLKIAAQLVDEHKHSYWHKQIEPLINANQHLVEYVGEIGGDERDSFLGNALAFLFTPKWDEPFGLSMIEAMATGTPAIANRRGAVPEIVQIGRNGYTFDYKDRLGVEQVANFVHLINQAAKLDRATVRQTVEEKWSLDKMAENYEKVYRRMLNKNFIANCYDH